ncbi:hypothetical protein TRICI_003045 [Trichomonascus ciferrii]|uniref:Uncharacterized protein n=1 Tax=Trichomonascus ciferrii TaxID=44093 RepID=A0A642VB37_9ASCO|nr:hypothetical protein TRICI_003045 [Trichomonascus ciferrii]
MPKPYPVWSTYSCRIWLLDSSINLQYNTSAYYWRPFLTKRLSFVTPGSFEASVVRFTYCGPRKSAPIPIPTSEALGKK